MRKPFITARRLTIAFFCLLISQQSLAHNGSLCYAYPLGPVKVDGNFSDWPAGISTYKIGYINSDDKPQSDADFSAFFRIGYRADNRSLYVALQVTDDDFIEDTSATVSWSSQDGLELYLDARHLPFGSGVASFMYSKKLRNTNNAYYDPFAKKADWNIMEVAVVREGNTRYYEWRIDLGDEFAIGKTIGIDFQVFDLDSDKSFSFISWGSGDMKYVNPQSLGDVILMPGGGQLAAVTGNIAWDKKTAVALPGKIRFTNSGRPQQWFTAAIDSMGNYNVKLPAGKYTIELPEKYFQRGDSLYATAQKKPVTITLVAGKTATAPQIIIPSTPAPDLLPEKGILSGNFTDATARQVDHFISTYMDYYQIPGVSLALIKDGKMVYHQTYGVRNTFSGEPVDGNTLFEAASITKPVFAYAVQRLAERNIIHLDTPLYRYLPYEDIAHDERYRLITGNHVLTHQTGFPNWRFMNPDGKLDLKFTPGTQFGYSGEGFEYLKLVVEKVTGKKVEQVLQEEVVEPMGLYHTFFSRNDSLRQMAATGHYNMLPNYDELPAAPGMAYSMHTEAKIFTRFMLYLLEQKGLSAATYANMLQKQSDYNFEPGDEKPKYPSYMGVSLGIRETPWGKTFGHSGNNGDFKCLFEMYGDLKTGFVLFTNSNTSDKLLQNIGAFLVEGKDK